MLAAGRSAVLKHAGVEHKIRRPTGWRGSEATSWLQPEQAFAVIREAYGHRARV